MSPISSKKHFNNPIINQIFCAGAENAGIAFDPAHLTASGVDPVKAVHDKVESPKRGIENRWA
jgi:hypothetical protein